MVHATVHKAEHASHLAEHSPTQTAHFHSSPMMTWGTPLCSTPAPGPEGTQTLGAPRKYPLAIAEW